MTSLPSLIVPDKSKTTYTYKDALQKWYSAFIQNPSSSTFFQPVTYKSTYKCLELSHEDRVCQSQEYIDKKNIRVWEWETPNGKFKISYISMRPWNSAIDPDIPNIMLLHGFTASKYTWRYLAKPLVRLGFRVWAMDFLGSGHSDAPTDLSYDPRMYVKQMDEFMKAFGIERAHLIGHSLGGAVANLFAIRYPNRVISLMLVSPLLFPIKLADWYKTIGNMHSLIKFVGSRWGKEIIQYTTEKTATSAYWTTFDLQQYVEPNLRPGSWHMLFSSIENYDEEILARVSERYCEIKVPILVVFGSDDKTTEAHQAEKFKSVCPQSQVEIIPEGGHLVIEERPKTIEKMIEKFLRKQKHK